MRIAIASDHGGLHLKEILVRRFQDEYEIEDLGTHDLEPVDYPDFGMRVAEAVVTGQVDRGILVCGTGIGMAITANKVPGIRAAAIHDTYSARVAVEHNNLNVLALGGRVIGAELAADVVSAFLSARFAGGRHQRRLDIIARLEQAVSEKP